MRGGSLAVRVQSHPSRRETRERLLAGLDGLLVQVVEDSSQPPNPWQGYQKCLSDLRGYSHVLIIQDDAVVCKNFPEAVSRIAAAKPDNVVSLFVGGLKGRTTRDFLVALDRRDSYTNIYFRDIHHVVAVLWPAAQAKAFLDWTKNNDIPGTPKPRSDDAVFGAWARLTRNRILCTVPSLVQHPDDVVSTIGLRNRAGSDRGRVAVHYIGDGDPLELDWT